jgi:hypothetical protein
MQSKVAEGLAMVQARIEAIRRTLPVPRQIRLVAVSKLKPPELVQEAYSLGHRVFGENYVDELCSKAQVCPPDISWHLIGHLQSNKVKKLIQVPGLAVVETIDSIKLAEKLNKEWGKAGRQPLRVFLQVDTSGENTKSGVEPADIPGLAEYVARSCGHLSLGGLMTIGKEGDVSAFDRLRELREAVARALGVQTEELELSMGMSGDFEAAVQAGSTNIRVGSLIFGSR